MSINIANKQRKRDSLGVQTALKTHVRFRDGFGKDVVNGFPELGTPMRRVNVPQWDWKWAGKELRS